jgi:hypothetical protein
MLCSELRERGQPFQRFVHAAGSMYWSFSLFDGISVLKILRWLDQERNILLRHPYNLVANSSSSMVLGIFSSFLSHATRQDASRALNFY